MALSPFEAREFFHLAFLRLLAERLRGRPYALKGGMCLRLFHRSPRMSEDADYDVSPKVGAGTLRKAVDFILQGQALRAQLATQGIVHLESARSKQTETTQRWKVRLGMAGDGVLGAKIEFSRRGTPEEWTQGTPNPEVLSRYGMVPVAVQYYDSISMTVQKIKALAAARRNAVRDLFDLHHLFRTIGVGQDLVRGRVGGPEIARALEKGRAFTFKDFRSEVLPFLTVSLMDMYRTTAAFEALKTQVVDVLREIEG